jgi:hypothetical protein
VGTETVMVRKRHWAWERHRAYYGIALQNFVGWLATAFCFYFFYGPVVHRLPGPGFSTQPPASTACELTATSGGYDGVQALWWVSGKAKEDYEKTLGFKPKAFLRILCREKRGSRVRTS